MSVKQWGCCVALAGCVFVSAPHAGELTLSEAVSRTLARSPAVQAQGAAVDAARYRAELEGLAPPLTIGMELENVAGTGALSGVDGAETTLRLGRVFELGEKRAARQSVGAMQVARQSGAGEQLRLQLAADATHRFIDVLSMQALLELAEDARDLAEANRQEVARRVERNRSPATELDLADLALMRAELGREDAEHELASARVTLAVLWGEQGADFPRVAGKLFDLPDPGPFDVLAQRLPQNAEQQAFLLEARQIDARERLAQSARKPDLHATLGVRRLEALDDEALVLSFSMPLGSSARSAIAVGEQQAGRQELDARRSAAWLESYQHLFAQFQEMQHARLEVTTLRERMIPLAEKSLASTQAGYEQTRYSFLQVAQASAVLLALRRDAIDAAARCHQLLADIDRATALPGDPQP